MRSVRHGGYSERVISAVAAEVVGVELLEMARTSPDGYYPRTQSRVPRASPERHDWGSLDRHQTGPSGNIHS
jgi:hypothetical protein